MVAWRGAYALALAEYAKLPTEPPPDCYVCTAAARGHRRWVGADARGCNDQMRHLKAAELALMALAPRLHRRLRRVYDAWGPSLARRLRRPLVADLAYALLKPLEWACREILRLAVEGADARARRLYR